MINATLTPINNEPMRNKVIVKISGDWNDADWITEEYEYSLEDFQESGYLAVDAINDYGYDPSAAPKPIRDLLYELTPSGQPDGAEMHTLEIEDIYAWDAAGVKCAISW